jgi:hypothetical protein
MRQPKLIVASPQRIMVKDIIGAQEIQTISNVNLCPNSLLELSSKNAIVCAILNA